MKVIIIAAGSGSRLNKHSSDMPKTLTPIGEQTIIDIIIQTLKKVGIREIALVCGFKKEMLKAYLGDGSPHGVKLTYIFNPQWENPNGISVWTAKDFVKKYEPFLLLMSDHIFDIKIADLMVQAPLAEAQLLLAVDANPERVFDIDDAMKVQFIEKRGRKLITAIGKKLPEYNGIDCGLFKCDSEIFRALEASFAMRKYALADGCRETIKKESFFAIDIGDAFWIDIDTPESLAYAQKQILENKELKR
ncbi:MAG: sugar phosphate nucleotidyltransferase [bacterium]